MAASVAASAGLTAAHRQQHLLPLNPNAVALVQRITLSARSRCGRAPIRHATERDRPAVKQEDKPQQASEDIDAVTRKFGLEAGLWKAWTSKDADGNAVTAQDLLKRYGGAYLLTSITLAIISFSLCYLAVDAGVDVKGLVAKIGITMSDSSLEERAGTIAIAYAAHKALSPVRFPPTVVLTPIVANYLGKRNSDAK